MTATSTTNDNKQTSGAVGCRRVIAVILMLVAMYIACHSATLIFDRHLITWFLLIVYTIWLLLSPWSMELVVGESKKRFPEVEFQLSVSNLPTAPFLIHSAHQRILDGQSRKLKIHWKAGESSLLSGLFGGSFFLSIACVFTYITILSMVTNIQVNAIGIATQATVTGCETSYNRSNQKQYSLTYQFYVPEETTHLYTGEFGVTADICQGTAPKSAITIRYLPSDPNISNRPDRGDIILATGFLPFIAAICAVSLFGLLGVGFLKQGVTTHRNIRRLQDQGILLSGIVVECKGEHNRLGFVVDVTYQFKSPDGQIIVDQTTNVRDDLMDTRLPVPGTPVVLIFAGQNCYKLL